jgi:putative SOS response-associated peptidase YedK
MVRFHEKHQGLLLAAGLWDHWQDRATKSTLNSFAIVTDEPDSFVKEVGHDRMPIFLTQQGVEHWLDPQQHDPAKLLQTLKEQKALVEWAVDRDRPMKAGWERRV